ncbi:MAG: HAD family hydrolase [Adhaeribacter sp.]
MKEKFAVLFDMDGVIIDSNPYHKDAWMAFCRRYQVELREEDVPRYIYGKTNKTALVDVFQREFSPEESFRMSEEKEAIYRELHRPDISLIKGLPGLLEEFRQHQVPLAVCTNAPVANLDFMLEETGIRPYFQVLIDASKVSKGKPDPEIYLKAAQLLGIAPERCIVMEDSTVGVEAGLRAGMKVVGITTTHSRQELAHTHLVIDDFDELSVDKLEALLP